MNPVLVLRVAARFSKLADQPAGQRARARKLTTPINKPKALDKEVADSNAETMATLEEAIDPNKRDITPKDVFNPSPNQMGVLNFVETGKDFQTSMVRKDKGYDTVKNLSPYLIKTDGGGGTNPQGRK